MHKGGRTGGKGPPTLDLRLNPLITSGQRITGTSSSPNGGLTMLKYIFLSPFVLRSKNGSLSVA